MVEVVRSRGGVPVRLTAERWSHIVEEHSELAGLRADVLETVAEAEAVHEGAAGELLASRIRESGHALVVVYRETSPHDGFIITAFLTRRPERLDRRPKRWPRKT